MNATRFDRKVFEIMLFVTVSSLIIFGAFATMIQIDEELIASEARTGIALSRDLTPVSVEEPKWSGTIDSRRIQAAAGFEKY
jgi:hypothetical protein